MKLEKGENKFRILSKSPIIGYEYWTEENKPVRLRDLPQDRPDDLRLRDEKMHWTTGVKHFWAFVVWNYQANAIQILELTQTGIQNSLTGFFKDPEWGHPNGYDISIMRTGDGMETKYQVIAKPPKPISQDIEQAFEDKPVVLEALYEGADPFNYQFPETQGMTEEELLNTF